MDNETRQELMKDEAWWAEVEAVSDHHVKRGAVIWGLGIVGFWAAIGIAYAVIHWGCK